MKTFMKAAYMIGGLAEVILYIYTKNERNKWGFQSYHSGVERSLLRLVGQMHPLFQSYYSSVERTDLTLECWKDLVRFKTTIRKQ